MSARRSRRRPTDTPQSHITTDENLVLDLQKFPDYFRSYYWQGKHSLYGYPADSYPNFEWMVSLERRFNWLSRHCEIQGIAAILLLKEMIQWGGSQNGALQKFEDGIERHHLQQLVLETVTNLQFPDKSISAALEFPGMGLTYASKMLRFFYPENYGALDSRIRKKLIKCEPSVLPTIHDSSSSSMVAGYVAFTSYITHIKTQLNATGIVRPECALPPGVGSAQWRSADIEMALFGWASSD